ncbi:tail protein X [Labrenzia sp. R4_2]|uniref:tail protein X n=1 Tax=Labrenzia sp. R4_2 TaxID=2821107 RepID=UPI00256FBECC|nr:tail protein X [Labrenzia sp. R4_2]
MMAVKTGEFLEHLTLPGDRWDTIAWAYYNDADAMDLIIEANRDLFLEDLSPVPPILPPGLRLRIPVVEDTGLEESLLPPWKRSG